jgi:hypothetical protein
MPTPVAELRGARPVRQTHACRREPGSHRASRPGKMASSTSGLPPASRERQSNRPSVGLPHRTGLKTCWATGPVPLPR